MADESEVHFHSRIFRLVVALACFAAVFFGVPWGSHQLREREADQMVKGETRSGAEVQHELAQHLAMGYQDTAAFKKLQTYLEVADEKNKPFVDRNIFEKNVLVVAAVAAVLGFLASFEASRVFARKKIAQGQISRLGQGPPRPGTRRF